MFGNERLKALPDVPTFKEKGYDVFPYGPLVQMAYIVAPAKTPPAVREKLIAMFKKWINTDKYRSTSAAGGGGGRLDGRCFEQGNRQRAEIAERSRQEGLRGGEEVSP